MDRWQEGFISANGVDLHYIRTGNGEKPALLLLHGLTDNGRYWSRTARALEDRFDIIMLDQRGHGQSSKPPEGYSDEEMADDAVGVIRALDLAPVAVLGHSMGASVALALAAAHPDLVTRTLLLDPPLRLPPRDKADQEQHRQRMEEWRQNILNDQQFSHAELEHRCVQQHPTWATEDCHYWAESHLQVYPDAIRLFHVRQPWQARFRQLACPTLLMHGDSELGSIVDDALAAEVARLARNVEVAHIEGAGHSAQREQFDAYIAVVREFLG